MKNMMAKLKVLEDSLITIDRHLIKFPTLAKWRSWSEVYRVYQKFVGSIPGRGNITWGCAPVGEATDQCFYLTSVSSLPPSLPKINKHILW